MMYQMESFAVVFMENITFHEICGHNFVYNILFVM